MSILYRLLVGSIRLAAPLFSVGASKLARGMEGRRHAHDVLATWGRGVRDPHRPVAWFHAPSVGEGLQAEAVMTALRALRPDLQIVFTFFSPSAEGLAGRIGADVATYLPWDLRRPVSTALDAIRPGVLCFTKTEVWPVLVEEAVSRGVPVAIVGTTLPDGAGRMRWPARALLRSTWERLELACAIDDIDTSRLIALGVAERAVHTTGDPGIDSALRRASSADPGASYLAPFHAEPRPTVVAGSTWEADEAVLLPALRKTRDSVPGLRAIIAPHEPEPEHVASLGSRLRQDGWRTATLSEVEARASVKDVDAVVIDRVGVLAHLYSIASISYVGGGFHHAGLHSVLEPAAVGTPVVFGPRHGNTRAAGDLLTANGAKIASDGVELSTLLSGWFHDDEARKRTGVRAFGYIDAHRGAADRTAVLLDELMKCRDV